MATRTVGKTARAPRTKSARATSARQGAPRAGRKSVPVRGGDSARVVMAIPKGRVLPSLVERLARAGVDGRVLLEDDRTLVRDDPRSGIRFLLLKPDDVPTYVEYGAADLGVVGRDILLEREYDLYAPLDLGIGRCRLVVAGKHEARPQRAAPCASRPSS